MKVDFSGVVTKFDQVPLGGFFQFDRSSGGGYGICVGIAENKRAVISLPTPASRDIRFGWLTVGGINHQTLVYFPDAVLRPVLSSIAEAGSMPGSVLICAGEKRFIRAYEDGMHHRTFNIDTGLAEQVAPFEIVYFTKWRVGQIVDRQFEELYVFPPLLESAPKE